MTTKDTRDGSGPNAEDGTRIPSGNPGPACGRPTPANSSWLNRIEAQFTALRYFTLDRAGHKEQGSMIRRYIIWRNRHAGDTRLRQVVTRANVA